MLFFNISIYIFVYFEEKMRLCKRFDVRPFSPSEFEEPPTRVVLSESWR